MKAIKKNGYTIITLVFFVISLSVLILFLTLFKQSTQVDSTIVGSVYIGDAENEIERRGKLTKGVNEWKKNTALYTLSLQGIEVQIGCYEKLDDENNVVLDKNGDVVLEYRGIEFLDFDYDTTVSRLTAGSDNIVYYTVNEKKKQEFYDILVENYSEYFCSDLDYDRLIQDIEKKAQEMTSIVDFSLYDYLKSHKSTTVVTKHLKNLDEQTIDKLVDIFSEEQIPILPISQTKNKTGFSAIEYFSDEKFSEMSSADMSIIATGLAALVQETSFTVTVKNQGFESDRYYADKEMTARINPKDGTDLRIINPEDSTYYVQIDKEYEGEKAELKFTLIGCIFVAEYTVIDIEKITIAPKITYLPQKSNFSKEQADGIDHEKGAYYIILSQGRETVLYSFKKMITYVDGSTEIIEIYPKQEYYAGTDEIRMWNDREYQVGGE